MLSLLILQISPLRHTVIIEFAPVDGGYLQGMVHRLWSGSEASF